MKRRDLLRGLMLVGVVAIAPPVLADPMDEVARQLRAQGFRIREVSRTWLGRIRVIAESDSLEREIVFDRSTGEIRRDLVTEKRPAFSGRRDDGEDRGRGRDARADGSRGGGGNSGRGGDRDDDDDDDDDNGDNGGDDDDDDDDDDD